MRSAQQTFAAQETYFGPLAPLAAALLAMATDVLDVLEDAIALDEIQAAAEAPYGNGQGTKQELEKSTCRIPVEFV